ncbi:hypothetical protein GCM10020254_22660 [Streptomyces goshikiensis]
MGSTTVKWQVSRMAAGGGRRPRKGDETVDFTCPRCRKTLSVAVESLAKAGIKYVIYRALAWLLALSLLVTLPMLIHLGGQTVEEGHGAPRTGPPEGQSRGRAPGGSWWARRERTLAYTVVAAATTVTTAASAKTPSRAGHWRSSSRHRLLSDTGRTSGPRHRALSPDWGP